MPDKPYQSEHDNLRPGGEGPPQPQTTPAGGADDAHPKTRTNPHTGEPTGETPEKGAEAWR